MCQRTIFSRSGRRMAEEAQLRAELEFMKEAKKIIKQQRNCLQIERLHLDSIRQQLLNPKKTKKDKKESSEPGTSKEGTSYEGTSGSTHPAQKPTEMMSVVDMMNLGNKMDMVNNTNMDADLQCNNQQLNLNPSFDATTFGAVTSYTTNSTHYDYYSDEDSSSDEFDPDDVVLDMNMLMNTITNPK